MQYEVGDGHRHWHAVDFEGYRLFRLGVADPTPRVGAKFGFCFFDVRRIRPFARHARGYLESGCGTPSSTRVHVGLSAGWGDIYPWDFAGQYVDVTGLKRGEYLLCVTADPARSFRQANTTQRPGLGPAAHRSHGRHRPRDARRVMLRRAQALGATGRRSRRACCAVSRPGRRRPRQSR